MNVRIGTVAVKFLFREYLFRIFGIVSLRCLCTSPYVEQPIFNMEITKYTYPISFFDLASFQAMLTLLLSVLLELCRISAFPSWSLLNLCTVFALNVLECYVNPGLFTYTQAPGTLSNSGVCPRFKYPLRAPLLTGWPGHYGSPKFNRSPDYGVLYSLRVAR